MTTSDLAPAPPREEPLPLRTLLAFSAPSAGLGFAFFLVTLYLLKFSTDVLLVSPAVMGGLIFLSKLWDAVSDPVAGHLSDRTRSRFGRRRSWLLAALPVLAVGNLMLWSPPAGLEGPLLALWMGLGLFAFYTATTMFTVPHESLAAELSVEHHERTRVFGIKHGVGMGGTLLAVGGLIWLGSLHDADRIDAERRVASGLALGAVVVTALLAVLAVRSVKERPEHQGRGGVHLHRAFADVLANPHARILLAVFFIENFGTAVLAVLTPFVMDYVLGMSSMTGIFILFYFVPAVLLIPLWIRLSSRWGKKRLWLLSMALLTFVFGSLFLLGEGDWLLACILGLLAGVGGGCGQVVSPSIQADVVDYDEYRTGQRKEGVYFAVWNFVRKAAHGLTAAASGLMLAAVGYEPNAEQTEAAKLGMKLLFGIVPGVTFAVGTLLFLRFRLDEAAHAGIRRALDARRRGHA
jgi:GPH family glycoside/pentoside/hexuronide:cation symporter